MGWIIFGITFWLAAVLFVPLRYWKKLWMTGIAGMIIIYFIDSTLIALGAFEFIYAGLTIHGLPLPYWLTYFPGGILFAYYRPIGRWWGAFYIMMMAFILWILEFLMLQLGYFNHINWTLRNSYILNIGGFIIVLWFCEWFAPDKKESSYQHAVFRK